MGVSESAGRVSIGGLGGEKTYKCHSDTSDSGFLVLFSDNDFCVAFVEDILLELGRDKVKG